MVVGVLVALIVGNTTGGATATPRDSQEQMVHRAVVLLHGLAASTP
jgi:hypothetical protein